MKPLLRALALGLAVGGCAPVNVAPPTVVPSVDLHRYAGTWYEIARFPFRVQEGCYATRATYTLRDDGRVDVLNECRKGSFEGERSAARAVARVTDPGTNAKLKVTFFWPFEGDYWIVDLGAEYDYAVVSGPERKYLWILSRTPTLGEDRYERIVAGLRERGFDTGRLLRTPQRASWEAGSLGR